MARASKGFEDNNWPVVVVFVILLVVIVLAVYYWYFVPHPSPLGNARF